MEKMLNIDEYIKESKINRTTIDKIRDSIWDKEIDITISPKSKCTISKLNDEEIFLVKVLFYMGFASNQVLKLLFSPIWNSNKYDYEIRKLTDAGILMIQDRGYIGNVIYLSKRVINILYDNKNHDKHDAIKGEQALENQYYRHILLVESVIKNVLSILEEVWQQKTDKEKLIYTNRQFYKNITYDLASKLADYNKKEFLQNLGYTDAEIKRFMSNRRYAITEREKFYKKLKARKDKSSLLGKDSYFEKYQEYFEKTTDYLIKYYFLYELIEESTDIDFFELLKAAIRPEVKNKDTFIGVKNNLLKYQTDNLRNVLEQGAKVLQIKNSEEQNPPIVLKYDLAVDNNLDIMRMYNMIKTNLLNRQTALHNKGTLCESEVDELDMIVSNLERIDGIREKLSAESKDAKRYLTFHDTNKVSTSDNLPIVYLGNLEKKQVFITDIKTRKDDKGRYKLIIDVSKIYRNKNANGLNNAGFRADYFGTCEFLKKISDDVIINFTILFTDESILKEQELKCKAVINNTKMIGADSITIKAIKEFKDYASVMEEINKNILI